MEQKTKELEELNKITKQLIQNKENVIVKYEKEIESKTKDYNLLLSQNKELLNKLNTGNTGNNVNKEQINEINENENYFIVFFFS